jgi:hypothetical protein
MQNSNLFKHDFINNMLRIEVLNNLLLDQIEEDGVLNDEYQTDLIVSLEKQIKMVRGTLRQNQ